MRAQRLRRRLANRSSPAQPGGPIPEGNAVRSDQGRQTLLLVKEQVTRVPAAAASARLGSRLGKLDFEKLEFDPSPA